MARNRGRTLGKLQNREAHTGDKFWAGGKAERLEGMELRALQKLNEFDRSCPFGSWIRGISAKLIMAHFRKAKSDIMITGCDTLEYLSQLIEHIHEKSGDTWEQKIDALRLCIDALPDRYQRMIQLRYFEDQPASKISDITKIALETVRKRLQRARSQLLDCLKRKKVVMEVIT